MDGERVSLYIYSALCVWRPRHREHRRTTVSFYCHRLLVSTVFPPPPSLQPTNPTRLPSNLYWICGRCTGTLAALSFLGLLSAPWFGRQLRKSPSTALRLKAELARGRGVLAAGRTPGRCQTSHRLKNGQRKQTAKWQCTVCIWGEREAGRQLGIVGWSCGARVNIKYGHE